MHSTKKPWTKPVLRTFDNPEDAAAYFRGKTTGVEKEKVEELLERMRRPAAQGSRTRTEAMNDDRQGEAVLKTITLSDREIRAAACLLNALVGDDRGKELTKLAPVNFQPTGSHDRAILVERARQTFVNRARRSRNFNGVMFGEAAWDMLLALYVTEHSTRHTVTGLVNLSGVPSTTALRWLDFLEKKEELVTRIPSLSDGRIHLIELTDKARDALDAYFSGTFPEGM